VQVKVEPEADPAVQLVKPVGVGLHRLIVVR
jgi:hypothetical protein